MSKSSLKINVLKNQKDNRQSIDKVITQINYKLEELKEKSKKS